MNCKQFNTIPLEEVLFSLGHLPTKQNEKEAWYLNPFANESEASFKLDKRQNLWFLHSEGIGGNNTDFIEKYLNCSVSEVLSWAEKQNFSSFHQQKKLLVSPKTEYQITGIYDLQNQNLKNYLQERGLSPFVCPFIKEVHFTIGDKNFYAIGFENQSEGFELRNSFYKGSLLKKDISIIKMNNDHSYYQGKRQNIAVFEGFIDALSFIEMKKHVIGDIIVMNSTALIGKVKEQLKNYPIIALYLDNDNAGLQCKSEILQAFPHAVDCSKLYSEHKDLNEYLIQKIKTEKNIEAEYSSESLQESREKTEKQESENKHSFKRER